MKYRVDGTDLTSVADAIRTKGGTSDALEFPDGFVEAIGNISGGGSTLITKSITANGTYSASADNADGYSSVTINVPQTTSPFEKVRTYTLEEAWEKSATAMAQTVLDGYLDANAVVYVLVFNGNTNTSGYRVDAIIIISNATTVSDLASNASGTAWKNYYASMGTIGSNCRASQGTTVDVYRLLHS